jgi:hypothetical protein
MAARDQQARLAGTAPRSTLLDLPLSVRLIRNRGFHVTDGESWKLPDDLIRRIPRVMELPDVSRRHPRTSDNRRVVDDVTTLLDLPDLIFRSSPHCTDSLIHFSRDSLHLDGECRLAHGATGNYLERVGVLEEDFAAADVKP